MIAALLPALLPIVGDIFKKVIPDPGARAAAEREFALALAAQEQQLALAVHETNKAEAQHRSIFVAGWRPAVGWMCAGAVGWHFILSDLLSFTLSYFGATIPVMPELQTQELIGLLMAMLGIGGYRTAEKISGVAK